MKYVWGLLVGLSVLVIGWGLWQQQIWGKAETTAYVASELQVRGILIPHHMLVRDKIEGLLQEYPCQVGCRFVFLSPLHQGERVTAVLWGKDELDLTQGVGPWASEAQLLTEHTISDVVPLLEQHWPQLQHSQLVVSNHVPIERLKQTAEWLAEKLSDDLPLFLVVSVDFSHYLSAEEAKQRDEKTLRLIEQKRYQELLTLDDTYLDGRAALYVFLEALAKVQSDRMQVVEMTNSGILMRMPFEQTTSHIYAVFK